MKRSLIAILSLFFVASSLFADNNTTRRQRNYITDGNKLYRQERYAEAEVAYRKALETDAMNEIAQFNLAASLLRQGSATEESQKEATIILNNLAKDAENISIAEKAFYNLGNIAFNAQDYAKSIELYKNALRKNPDNDKARENLRLAQKRLQDQQQNQDNQDKNNQDNQDQQDQQDNKDQQDQQDKKDQQNQDKDKKDNQDKNSNNPQQDKQNQQPENQQNGGISQQNAEKILKAMENEENATRARINAEKNKNGAPGRRPVTNPW